MRRVGAFTLVLIALLLPCAPAAAERQIKVIQTPNDVASGFAGGGFTGIVMNSTRHVHAYDLVLLDAADNVIKVNRPGTQASRGAIDGSSVVYVERRGGSHRAVVYDVVTSTYSELALPTSPNHVSMSGDWVLYDDGSERAATSVRLYNRMTGEVRRIAFGYGKRSVYAGQVAGEWAVWGRWSAYAGELYTTNIATGATLKLRRPRGVGYQYSPAVTADGTVYFARNRPCVRRCPAHEFDMHFQLVERRLSGQSRVVTTLPRGADVGPAYAAQDATGTSVLYSRYFWLRDGGASYGDLFEFRVTPL